MTVQQIQSFYTKQPMKTAEYTKSNSNFKSELKKSMSEKSEVKEAKEIGSKERNELSEKQLQELNDFLKTTDLTQVDGGLAILEKFLMDENIDLGSLVAEFLGLSEEELKKLLQDLLKEENPFASLEQLMQNLLNSSKVEINQFTTNSATAIKAVKLFDLLLANKQLTTGEQENKFIQLALDKVSAMLSSQKESRAAYLNQTFSNLLTDVASDTTTKADISSSNQLLVGTQPQMINSNIQWSTTQMNAQPTKTTADHLIQQFESILAKSNLSTTGNTQKMLIRLYPESLGSLRIELIQKDNALIARILTSSTQAKEILESQLNVLRQAFNMQNIQVDKLEINQSFVEQQNYLEKDHSQEKNQSNNQFQEEDETETTFALNLEELLKEEVEI